MNRLILIGAILLLPLAAYAYNESDVRFTVHNMAYNLDITQGLTNADRQIRASNAKATQVCIFCHTPHNAGTTNQLWNHVNRPGATYLMYSSTTLRTTAAKSASLTADSPSVICLGCHDGLTAINVLHSSSLNNSSVPGVTSLDINMGTPGQGFAIGDINVFGSTPSSNLGASYNPDGSLADAKAGNNLRDDHPIGFSYQDAASQSTQTLHTPSDAAAKGIRFFGSTKRVECSSCHDPHIFYGMKKVGGTRQPLDAFGYPAVSQAQMDRTPFLVMSNSGSGLCLACHNK